MASVNRDDWKRWVENHRHAAEKEIIERRQNPGKADQAMAASMALLRYYESLHGSPFGREDPVSSREDEQLWDSWAKLRARWSNGR
jgi:hypothetical protein